MAWKSDVPTLKVEIALASDALNDSPSWTDVSAHVRDVSIRYGRSDETQMVQPASARVVLSNRTRLFDPWNPTGYGGWLQPKRQIRITATWNFGDFRLFWGHVKGWPQQYDPSNNDAWVELDCTDMLTHVAGIDLPDFSGIINRFGQPTFWYPLADEESGEFARVAREATRNDAGLYSLDNVTTFVDFKQPPLVGDGNSVRLQGGASIVLSAGTRPFLLDPIGFLNYTRYTMGVVFSAGRSPSGLECPVIDSTSDVTGNSTRVVINQDGTMSFWVASGIAGAVVQGSTAVTDGRPHSVIARRDGTAIEFWVDGVSQGTATMGGAVYAAGPYIQLGNYITTYSFDYSGSVPGLVPFEGNLQHFVAWESPLTNDQITLLGRALIGFRGDTPRDRVMRLLELGGLAAFFEGGDSGASLGAIQLGGSLLSELQATAVSEAGVLATDPLRTDSAGISKSSVTFFGRYYQTSAGTPIGLTDDNTANPALNLIYSADRFEVQFDDRFLVNECRVSGSDGIEHTATDTASQAMFGVRSRSIDTRLGTLEQVRSYAEYIVGRYAYPEGRAGRVTLRPQRNPAYQWELALGLRLMRPVTLTRKPKGGSATPITLDCLVDGIEHRLDSKSGEWIVTVTASPRDPVLDDPTMRWVLGTSLFDDETILYF